MYVCVVKVCYIVVDRCVHCASAADCLHCVLLRSRV